VYEVVVEWQGRELGRGQGASKKEAETRAALAALEGL
jgi:dsRNA-specific ribonuclease